MGGNAVLEIVEEKDVVFVLRNKGSYVSKRPSWLTSFYGAVILYF